MCWASYPFKSCQQWPHSSTIKYITLSTQCHLHCTLPSWVHFPSVANCQFLKNYYSMYATAAWSFDLLGYRAEKICERRALLAKETVCQT